MEKKQNFKKKESLKKSLVDTQKEKKFWEDVYFEISQRFGNTFNHCGSVYDPSF